MAIGIPTARLLRAVFLMELLVAGTRADVICGEGLEEYDVASLAEQQYWYFNVDKANCIAVTGEMECQVSFSICHNLDDDFCSGPSAVCMSVVDNNGVISFNLGQNEGSTSMNQPNGTGFTYIFPNGDNTTKCNTSAQTMLSFECDKSASWDYKDPGNNNVTQYVTPSLEDGCLFVFNLKYSGACPNPVPVEPINCEVPGYNVKPLESMTWFGSPPPGQCFYPSNLLPIGLTCNVYFSFCQLVNAAACYNSVFCVVDSSPNTTISYSLGAYNPDLKSQATKGSNEFVIEYEGGKQINQCPDGLMAILTFVCNENANWLDLIDGNVTQYMNATRNEEFCQYDVVFQYNGACSSSPAIVGWILMAIVIGIAFIYFITGAIVQYVRGRRGIELIPNLDFWKIFLVLVLEGCRFTLDIITCYQLRSSIPKSVGKRDYEDL